MYHVPLDFKCIYGVGDKRCENVDGEDMSEVCGGGERVEITRFLECR